MKQIALTYDDGPNDPYTLDLLDLLSTHGIKATFFMIGKWVRQRPDIARRVAAEGHTIGNHTNTHPDLRTVTLAEAAQGIAACECGLTDAVGTHSRCFRPPYLRSTREVDDHVRAVGLSLVRSMSIGRDWDPGRTAEDVVDTIVEQQAGQSGVVMLHDGSNVRMGEDRSTTVRATERLIIRFKQEGYEFVADPVPVPQRPPRNRRDEGVS